MFDLGKIICAYQQPKDGKCWQKIGEKLTKRLAHCWLKNIGPTSPKSWANINPTLAVGWANIGSTLAQRRPDVGDVGLMYKSTLGRRCCADVSPTFLKRLARPRPDLLMLSGACPVMLADCWHAHVRRGTESSSWDPRMHPEPHRLRAHTMHTSLSTGRK